MMEELGFITFIETSNSLPFVYFPNNVAKNQFLFGRVHQGVPCYQYFQRIQNCGS